MRTSSRCSSGCLCIFCSAGGSLEDDVSGKLQLNFQKTIYNTAIMMHWPATNICVSVCVRQKETLGHPEITCSIFPPYPVWLKRLVIKFSCFGSSVSPLLFLSLLHEKGNQGELQGQGRWVKTNETISLLAACCLRDEERTRDESVKSSDHLCVCLTPGVQRRGELASHAQQRKIPA